MWTLRSAAYHVAPAFICLLHMFIAGGANAQTASDASDSKPVQVLQIREVGGTNESAVKKSKATAMPAKKKVAQRKTAKPTKAAANEGANTPVQSAIAAAALPMPAQNDDTLVPSAEQTGTLAVGDRAVAFASSPGEDNVGLSVANSVGTREDPAASAIAVGNQPSAISDTERTPGTPVAEQKAPSSKNSPLSRSLAMLSGAMLAVAFGWYLVGSSRRRISLGVTT
jgi:hypothetical protein